MADKKLGRPSGYTEEIGEEICLKISTSGKGIQRLCKDNPHWPCFQTIYEWRLIYPLFGEMYIKAKKNQVELLVDEALDIADDSSLDTIVKTTKTGEEYEVCNTEWVNRSRLRIDTRKWLASKLEPMRYGDKIQNNVDVTVRQEDAIRDLE
jgi:hypothetical protein